MHPTVDDPPDLLPLAPTRSPRRSRGARWVLVALLATTLLVTAAVVVIRHRAAAAPTAASAVPVETAELELRDLSTARSLPGSIGYGTTREVSGHQDATVTWLPKVGTTIKRGDQLYRADDQMVPLFYGGMPMYRDISGLNLVGRDVRIMADNLQALGYSIGRQPSPGEWVTQPTRSTTTQNGTSLENTGTNTKNEPNNKNETAAGGAANGNQEKNDLNGTNSGQAASGAASTPTGPRKVKAGEGVLTTGLIQAIKRWQADMDRPVTGTIAVGDVEVSSGAVRVDSVAVPTGSPASAALLSVTSIRKVITVGAELADAASIERGDRVTVVLPDERKVKARVIAVGRDLAGTEDGGGPPKLAVTVSVNKPQAIAKLDSADVEVLFVGRTAKDVLAAPIEALTALREGGYAVQGPSGLVAVETGMFADGWVEITGTGLAEGTKVVVSS